MRAAVLGLLIAFGDVGAAPAVTLLRPVGMTGPFPTIDDACESAKPCGATDTGPAKIATCSALEPESSGHVDPNASPPSFNGPRAELRHASGAIAMQIASQQCPAPKGVRSEQDIYYVFVKRADGWWRSHPLWEWSYNDKYGGGSMIVRWNDQPGRTFVGVAAGLHDLACEKNGDELTTEELMIRIEPGTTRPLVWGPLVVGQAAALTPYPSADPTCRASATAQELTEHWTSADELELTGSATWPSLEKRDGILQIGWHFHDAQPSSVGKYRFIRP